MPPLYVSYHTPAYAGHAAGLVASLAAHGLEQDVRGVASAGSWLANVNGKPGFLLWMMAEHPGRALVWLDADARVRRPPDLFDSLDCDFAAHWRHSVELLSGTMYFAPTAPARRLLEAWRDECAVRPDRWDQKTLQAVIERGVAGLRVEKLPSTYTRIFDAPKMGEPVVEHLQASRQLRCAAPT